MSLEAFRKQLKDEPYFKDTNLPWWVALGPSGGWTKKTALLDFQAMPAVPAQLDRVR